MLCQQMLNDTAWFVRGPECSVPQVNKLLRHATRPRHTATPLVPASAAPSLQGPSIKATNGAERLPPSGRYILEASRLPCETGQVQSVVRPR